MTEIPRSNLRTAAALPDGQIRQTQPANESDHLRTLCEIMTEDPLDIDDQIYRALKVGLAMLQLDLGIVSKTVDNNCMILYFSPEDADVQKGQIFDLASTYCQLPCMEQDVVAIDHMAKSTFSGHPCYAAFGLESYIGAPFLIEGKPYGTVNFSSTVPRIKPFSETERNFVRLMGRWVGARLAANFQATALQNYQTKLEKLVAERTAALRRTNTRLLEESAENEAARKSLLKQQSFLSTLIETIPIPVFYKDTSGRYLGCNKAFEQFSEKSRSEIIYKTVYHMAPKDIAEKYEQRDRELFENPGTQQYEWKFPKRNGEERTIIFQKATFEDENGNIAGLVGSIFDITERIKLDKQLIRAQKLQAIGTLSNGIAHDFNNILSAMMGYTELARMKLSGNSQVRTDLDKVYTAGQRAVELVKQILTFSRESDQTIQPIEVGPLIKEVLKLLKASLPSTIEIRSSIRSEATILADPTQLHQVLMNLCTNAGHAMMAEGGVLEVVLDSTLGNCQPESSADKADTMPLMQLQVKDTGTGIPQHIIDRIFDPFFTTKDPGEGTGLGLSVVHGIIQDLGGKIDVTSKLGAGTVFKILVPLATEAEATRQLENELSLAEGSEKILFVDDEELLVNLNKSFLENMGYSVTGCTSSSEALAVFRDNPHGFDLVITDETMPNMTGKTLAAEINKIRPELPIILCSGYLSSLEKDNAAAWGIKAVLLKPVLAKVFSETVRQVLDKTAAT